MAPIGPTAASRDLTNTAAPFPTIIFERRVPPYGGGMVGQTWGASAYEIGLARSGWPKTRSSPRNALRHLAMTGMFHLFHKNIQLRRKRVYRISG
jgi:hypothetical protein